MCWVTFSLTQTHNKELLNMGISYLTDLVEQTVDEYYDGSIDFNLINEELNGEGECPEWVKEQMKDDEVL